MKGYGGNSVISDGVVAAPGTAFQKNAGIPFNGRLIIWVLLTGTRCLGLAGILFPEATLPERIPDLKLSKSRFKKLNHWGYA
jgi:hypothetical protein